MPESKEIKILRYMEWERAKGSLKAILASFWSWDKTGSRDNLTFEELSQMVDDFIKDFGESAALD